MRRASFAGLLASIVLAGPVRATEPPPLLPETAVRMIAAEVSGTAAKRNLQDLTLFHRMRGSKGLRAAAERVRDRAKEYGRSEVELLELPAALAAIYGPVPLSEVTEYLADLEAIGILQREKTAHAP